MTTRIPLKRSPWLLPMFLLFSATAARSYIEVSPGTLTVRFGFYRIVIPRPQIASATENRWPWYAGLGWRTDFRRRLALVGAHAPVVAIRLNSPCRSRLLGIPIRFKKLFVSVASPDMLRAALSETPGLPDLILDTLVRHRVIEHPDGWRLETLSGGTTTRTFSVIGSDGQPAFIARLARIGLGAWLRNEEATLRELSADPARCVPSAVTRVDDPSLPEGQLLVHAYVPGVPTNPAALHAAALESLATCLAWIHGHHRDGYMLWPSLAVHHGTRAACYRARVASLWTHSAAIDQQLDIGDLLSRMETLDLPAADGWDESAFALMHGDLSDGNIVLRDDGGVAFIDWEYARAGDPAEELAYLITEHGLAPDVVARFSDAYVAAGGHPWAVARIPVWLPYVALDSALWWAGYLPSDGAGIQERLAHARRSLGD